MKRAEIKEIPTQELAERIATEQEKYNQMRLNHAVSPLANPSSIKYARCAIAQLKTELRQRELNEK